MDSRPLEPFSGGVRACSARWSPPSGVMLQAFWARRELEAEPRGPGRVQKPLTGDLANLVQCSAKTSSPLLEVPERPRGICLRNGRPRPLGARGGMSRLRAADRAPAQTRDSQRGHLSSGPGLTQESGSGASGERLREHGRQSDLRRAHRLRREPEHRPLAGRELDDLQQDEPSTPSGSSTASTSMTGARSPPTTSPIRSPAPSSFPKIKRSWPVSISRTSREQTNSPPERPTTSPASRCCRPMRSASL